MNSLRLLELSFGGWWCGVRFSRDRDVHEPLAPRPMRFCEAVAKARTSPFALTPDLLDCPGGRRALGWNGNEELLAREMAEKANITIEAAHEVLRETPRIEDKLTHIIVGTCEAPDIVVAYSQPESAMKLLREWQAAHGEPLQTKVSAFMSVCGAVAVNAYRNQRICVSFGCPEARKHGAIGRDRLVIGLPVSEVATIVLRIKETGQAALQRMV